MIFRNTKVLIILAFFAIYVIWGSTYLFNKVAVSELPPFFLTATRFFTAGTIMILIAAILKIDLKLNLKQFKNTVVVAFFFLVFGNSIFIWALQFVDSGFSSLIASMQPLFVLVLMRIIDGKPMQKKSMIGIALGILGVFLLVNQQEIIATDKTLLGVTVMLFCVIGWSYGSVFVSKASLPKSFFVSTGYQMIIGSIIQALISFTLGETWTSPLSWSSKVQVSMVLLIVFGGIIAFTAFNYLLKVVSTEKVSTSAYVNPVIALFMGWYFLDENLTTQSIIASIILLTGVYFINSRKRK